MSLDHYVTLGNSGLRVSPFCLGAMTFGDDWGWGSDVTESESILAHYVDQGGNFFDTAIKPAPTRVIRLSLSKRVFNAAL